MTILDINLDEHPDKFAVFSDSTLRRMVDIWLEDLWATPVGSLLLDDIQDLKLIQVCLSSEGEPTRDQLVCWLNRIGEINARLADPSPLPPVPAVKPQEPSRVFSLDTRRCSISKKNMDCTCRSFLYIVFFRHGNGKRFGDLYLKLFNRAVLLQLNTTGKWSVSRIAPSTPLLRYQHTH